MKRAIIYLIASIAVLNSCRQEIKTRLYTDEETGFSIECPESWKPVSNEEAADQRKQGEELATALVPDSLKEEAEQEFRELEIKELVNVKKNEATFLQVNAQPFDPSLGTYREQQDSMFDLIIQAYELKEMPVEHVRSSGEIDGLEFQKFEIRIYNHKKNRVILKQVIYDRLIEGRFGLLLACTYVEDQDGEDFKKMLESAKFKYRN